MDIVKVNKENFCDFAFLVENFASSMSEAMTEEKKSRLKKDGLSENPLYEAHLGIIDGKPVSYVAFLMTYSTFLASPTLFLEDLFVLSEYRSRGVGQKMFDFCVNEALIRNCGRMDWQVLEQNKSAIKFYERNLATKLDWVPYKMDMGQLEAHKKLKGSIINFKN